jgi:phosphatidylglycerophosphate synthase
LLTCALFLLFETGKAGIWIAIILTTLYPFISVIQTEKALKKKFS